MIAGVVLLRRSLALLLVPLLLVPSLASCTKSWQDSGLPPAVTPGIPVTPSAAPAAAGVPASAGPVAPPMIEPVSACSLIGVRITADRGDAAMGYREMGLHLRNCGTKPYEVVGRPAIVVLDDQDRPLKIDVVPSVHYTADPRPLVLKPGQGARTVLSWRNTVTNIGGWSETGTSLAVAVSAGGNYQLVALPHKMDLGSTGRLEASAWF